MFEKITFRYSVHAAFSISSFRKWDNNEREINPSDGFWQNRLSA